MIQLYDLLPEIYRAYDAKTGRPLQALMSVLQTQYDAIEANIEALYDGWFIETCPDWAVPYIAALLGIDGLDVLSANIPEQRARVANTQLYRGRKGAMAVLGRAAGEASGWPAMASDNIDRLVCSQNLRSPRASFGGSANLRGEETAAWMGTPFSQAPRSGGFRASGAGPYVPGVAVLGLWRLQAYPVEGATPGRAAEGPFTFSPMGADTPLYTLPETPSDIFRQRRAAETPLSMDARRLSMLIARARSGQAISEPFAIRVLEKAGWRTIPLEAVAVMDLSQAAAPPDTVRWGPRPEQVSTIEAGVDPVRGRFVLKTTPAQVAVDYAYGFGMALGGGPYERGAEVSVLAPEQWNAVVGAKAEPGPGVYTTLQAALLDWMASGRSGVIRIADNATYTWPPEIQLDGRLLCVEAANGRHPHVNGDVAARLGGDGQGRGDLRLNGLWMSGRIRLQQGLNLTLRHCTLRSAGQQAIEGDRSTPGPPAVVVMERCIVGPLGPSSATLDLTATESILEDQIGGVTESGVEPANLSRHASVSVVAPGVVTSLGMTASGGRQVTAGLVAARFGQPAYGQAMAGRDADTSIGQAGAYYSRLQGQRLRNLGPVEDEFLPQQLSLRTYFAD